MDHQVHHLNARRVLKNNKMSSRLLTEMTNNVTTTNDTVRGSVIKLDKTQMNDFYNDSNISTISPIADSPI